MPLPASLVDFIGPPVAPPAPVDWQEVVQVLGTDLPSDYKELADKYPLLFINEWIPVTHPATPEPPRNPYNLTSLQEGAITQSRFVLDIEPEALEIYDPRARQTSRRDLPERKMPFAAYPEPGGLMYWGLAENNTMCCWHTEGHPDDWTIVTVYGRIAWQDLGGITSFLADLVTGRVRCPLFPDDCINLGDETVQIFD
ncbi:hypothetical protein [Actinomadura rayongensis]|uniref:SMI1/KNR4 family protein n=1 Tax=Actinomadura rayongensis TaxID=1429076 RepID=A0A6I4W1X9_9ACTN|nr:hypothetical protein [Actinomadura rayongensis]MXQ64579.1 hypothetical protein [Actinomadura rayongensis]